MLPNNPGERARLDAGDILVALGGERLTSDNFTNRVHELQSGRKAELTVLRGERLLTIEVEPIISQDENWSVYALPNPTPEQLQLRNAWLGVK